uniref:Uncharacterized protein n=1 Tax=Rhizophora mucronata TaxID=61149 RepID=A0A2P2J7S0_RHIMU
MSSISMKGKRPAIQIALEEVYGLTSIFPKLIITPTLVPQGISLTWISNCIQKGTPSPVYPNMTFWDLVQDQQATFNASCWWNHYLDLQAQY